MKTIINIFISFILIYIIFIFMSINDYNKHNPPERDTTVSKMRLKLQHLDSVKNRNNK